LAGRFGDRDDALDLEAGHLRAAEQEDSVVPLALVEVGRHLVAGVVALLDQIKVRHLRDRIGRGRSGIEPAGAADAF
jgi:hypothetical protein